jgi:hypothetical protein
MRLRPTRNVLLAAAVVLAGLLVSATAAGAAPGGASAQGAPRSLAEARKQVKDARRRQDAAQKALEAAERQRQLAEAREQEATRRLASVGGQLRQLRAVVGARARSSYMSGSAVTVATVVDGADADDLLDRMETVFQLAERSNQTLRDLNELEGVAAESRQVLARVGAEQRELERRMEQELARADRILAEQVAAEDRLRAESGAAADALAAETAAERAGGVSAGGGGACDLSGIPTPARNIIMQESRGIPTAKNPRSTAFGLGQLLLGNRIRYLGAANAWTTDCGLQYKAFTMYVMERYGSFSAAWAFKQAHGWY